MATITPTIVQSNSEYGSGLVVTWTGVTSADTCSAVQFPTLRDRSAHIRGTFNSTTVTIEGSNDGTNFVTLTDPQGNAISKTAEAIEQISEITLYIRPKVASGTADSITVVLILFGTRKGS